jgi:outer membrane protein OmpA-like peptidoglycan-associated protein
MLSLGAKCEPLALPVICAVGSVQSVFSHAEANEILAKGNSRVSCEIAGHLVIGDTVAATVSSNPLPPSTTAVNAHSAELSVVIGDRPSFRMDKKEVVYFAHGSHKLGKMQLQKIRQFVNAYGKGTHMLNITGHADSSGSNSFNHTLSVKRAGAVRNAMIDAGVDASKIISVSALGEESLRYRTKDNHKLPTNRAVEIKAYK